MFFHDESTITKGGGYESAIVPKRHSSLAKKCIIVEWYTKSQLVIEFFHLLNIPLVCLCIIFSIYNF